MYEIIGVSSILMGNQMCSIKSTEFKYHLVIRKKPKKANIFTFAHNRFEINDFIEAFPW